MADGSCTGSLSDAAAIVLAGGDSTRMGADKALLDFGGRPLIARVVDRLRPHFCEILISSNRVEPYGFLGLEVIPDREPGLGPLSAIATCLEHSSRELNFVIACDMPNVDLSVVRRMLALSTDYDAVVPVTAEGYYEPVFAVYRRGVFRLARDILATGGRRVTDLLAQVRVLRLADCATRCGRNINTPEDYDRALREAGYDPPSSRGG